MNWKRIPTGTVPFDITRPTSGPHEATRGELILSDGYDVELPDADPDAVVAVATVGESGPITVTASGSTDVCRVARVALDSREPVIFTAADIGWVVVHNDGGVRPTDVLSFFDGGAPGRNFILHPEGYGRYVNYDDPFLELCDGVAHTDTYHIATSGSSSTIKRFRYDTREVIDSVTQSDPDWVVTDGDRVFITDLSSNDIYVYEIDGLTHTKTFTDPGGTIQDIDIDVPQERMIVGSDDGTAYLYDVTSDTLIDTFTHFNSYQAVAVTTNYIATSAGKDIRFYDRADLSSLYWEYSAHNQTGSDVRDIVARTITDNNGDVTDIAVFVGNELKAEQLNISTQTSNATYDEQGTGLEQASIGRNYVVYSDFASLYTRKIDRDNITSEWPLIGNEAFSDGGIKGFDVYPK